MRRKKRKEGKNDFPDNIEHQLALDKEGKKVVQEIINKLEIVWKYSKKKNDGVALVISCLNCGNLSVASTTYEYVDIFSFCPKCKKDDGFTILGEI